MEIVRTPTHVAGGITPTEKTLLDAHAQLWIDHIMRTDPIEPAKIVPAIEALYAAAGFERPRVVIASSPLVMAFAGGFAAAIWHLRDDKRLDEVTSQATDQATFQATSEATRQATRQATNQATRLATAEATLQATDQATSRATAQATSGATFQATRLATAEATYEATLWATDQATRQATRQATNQATRLAPYEVVAEATRRATDQATSEATVGATRRATYKATSEATNRATDLATRQAMVGATLRAMDQATDEATNEATHGATRLVTSRATRQATYEATDEATYEATLRAVAEATTEATFQATYSDLVCFFLGCAKNWWRMYQGGNMWGQYDCYLSGVRDILGLRLPEHEKYAAWEQAAIHGGFRIMHPEFCIVSDFPEILRTDAQNRPHCVDGPSHRWRDGWSLFHVHGIRVDERIIMSPETITVEECMMQPNAEVRRVMIDRMGLNRFFKEATAETLDEDVDGQGMPRRLLRLNVQNDEPYVVVEVHCPSTERVYYNEVPPEMRTCLQAVAWSFDMDPEDYLPLVES